jgi:hypothetical protein
VEIREKDEPRREAASCKPNCWRGTFREFRGVIGMTLVELYAAAERLDLDFSVTFREQLRCETMAAFALKTYGAAGSDSQDRMGSNAALQ